MKELDLIKRAQEVAEEKIKEYNPKKLSPFPFEEIERNKDDLDIVLVPSNKDIFFGGFIEFDENKNKFTIFVNTKKPRTKQRFAIAHELGHYFLHQDIIMKEKILFSNEDFLSGSCNYEIKHEIEKCEIEIEANKFAASLIMPTKIVEEAWKIFRNVQGCAKIFKVSASAMSIRLEDLNLISDE